MTIVFKVFTIFKEYTDRSMQQMISRVISRVIQEYIYRVISFLQVQFVSELH